MKVDHAKEANERLLERVTDILSHTIPEQKIDAMKDYHKVIRTLEKGTDWRFKPIIANLQMLYMFPGRKLHNSVVVELHDLLEEVREKRINQVIENQRKKGLGETERQLIVPLTAQYIGIIGGLFAGYLAWVKISERISARNKNLGVVKSAAIIATISSGFIGGLIGLKLGRTYLLRKKL